MYYYTLSVHNYANNWNRFVEDLMNHIRDKLHYKMQYVTQSGPGSSSYTFEFNPAEVKSRKKCWGECWREWHGKELEQLPLCHSVLSRILQETLSGMGYIASHSTS